MARRLIHLLGCVALIATAGSCRNDPLAGLEPGTGPAVSDAELFALTQPGAGWVFYKRSATPITRTGAVHPEPQILVRFNAKAATQLDGAGKIRSGASFPDSSVIVKELATNGIVSTLAVMMKLRGSSSAGFDGWIWAEFGRTGQSKYSTSGRGAACSSCHSAGIDYTRMNDSHP